MPKLKRAPRVARKYDYIHLLRKCTDMRDLSEGRRLHAELQRDGYDQQQTLLGNLVIQMYGNCGCWEDARLMFDKLLERNKFSWNIMLAMYARNGHLQEARDTFDRMPESDVVSWNAILAAYSQHGFLREGRRFFDRMPERNVVSWNGMLAAYSQHRQLQDTRMVFERMPFRNTSSWNCMIQACIDNGQFSEARFMFDRTPLRNVISWTAMVQAYAQNGYLQEAETLFEQMPHEADEISLGAMVAAYAHNGYPGKARALFDRMTCKSIITWTAMITAYAQHQQGKEALELFRIMDLEGVHPDKVTFANIIDTCASFSEFKYGKLVHSNIVEKGLEEDVEVGTSLISLYGRSGCLEDARALFDRMPTRTVVMFTCMVATYAWNGHVKEALEVVPLMILEGVQTDDIVFISILFACSHAGLLEDGRQYFHSISRDYNMVQTLEHYACMVDLLGRAGRLGEAESIIDSMPYEPNFVIWRILLGGCRIHGDVKRGARASQRVFELDPESPSPYLLMSSIYAAAGDRDGAAKVKKAMKEMSMRKKHEFLEEQKELLACC